jgi:hypothetical protein
MVNELGKMWLETVTSKDGGGGSVSAQSGLEPSMPCVQYKPHHAGAAVLPVGVGFISMYLQNSELYALYQTARRHIPEYRNVLVADMSLPRVRMHGALHQRPHM